MLNNMQRNSGGVRVVFFFLAFVGICFYTPILIDDLIRRGSTPEHQIAQGADPTTVLKETGAGDMPDAEKCSSTDYLYGKSLDGYIFIKSTDNNLFAVDVDGATAFFVQNNKGVIVSDSVTTGLSADIARELTSVLADCMKSDATPPSYDISFRSMH